MRRESEDWTRLIRILRGLDRVDVAQFMAKAIDEMAADDVSADEITEVCSSVCRRLGTTAEDLRRALH